MTDLEREFNRHMLESDISGGGEVVDNEPIDKRIRRLAVDFASSKSSPYRNADIKQSDGSLKERWPQEQALLDFIIEHEGVIKRAEST